MLASRNRASLALASPRALCVPSEPTLSVGIGCVEIIDRAGRAGEMQDVVDRPVDLDRLGDVVLDELEPRVVEERRDVAARAGQQVVDADDLVAVVEESLAKMRPDEPRPAGDDRSQRASS